MLVACTTKQTFALERRLARLVSVELTASTTVAAVERPTVRFVDALVVTTIVDEDCSVLTIRAVEAAATTMFADADTGSTCDAEMFALTATITFADARSVATLAAVAFAVNTTFAEDFAAALRLSDPDVAIETTAEHETPTVRLMVEDTATMIDTLVDRPAFFVSLVARASITTLFVVADVCWFRFVPHDAVKTIAALAEHALVARRRDVVSIVTFADACADLSFVAVAVELKTIVVVVDRLATRRREELAEKTIVEALERPLRVLVLHVAVKITFALAVTLRVLTAVAESATMIDAAADNALLLVSPANVVNVIAAEVASPLVSRIVADAANTIVAAALRPFRVAAFA